MRYADQFCTYEERFNPHVYVYTGPCLKTGKPYTVEVPGEGLYKYRHGAKIQDAFSDMPAGDREFLMTGYSPEGWKEIFGDEEI